MARYRFCLLSALLLCSVAHCQGGLTTDPSVTITVPDVTTPSTAAPTSSATTTEKPTDKPTTTSTTTVKPTTTSTTTVKPTTTTTTTVKPTTTTTTTVKPTTTTEKTTTTTTTTAKPTTTTVTPPTPPPKPLPPKPLPAPTQGNWSYSENNVTCVMVQFAAQLNVTYTTNVTSPPRLAHALLNVPTDAVAVGGSCGNATQHIQLSWPKTSWANNLTLSFVMNATTHQYALSSLNVTLTPDSNFPNATSNASMLLWHAAAEWWTPVAISYKCIHATQLNMTEDSGAVATLTLSSMQEEAFRKDLTPKFSAARECGGGDLSDAVPIAVGCALGGLVAVVLMAYLVARRRSAARGYLSM